MRTALQSFSVPASMESLIEAEIVSRDAVLGVSVLMHSVGVSVENDPWLCAALAIALGNPESGNSCVDLSALSTLGASTQTPVEGWPKNSDEWRKILVAHPQLITVPDSEVLAPFILHDDSLYSAKSYSEEVYVASTLATMLLEGRLVVVSGGPGSGKTTSIAKRLATLMTSDASAVDNVALVAPTGLAAKRMKFALANALSNPELGIEISADVHDKIAEIPKSTVHKLLRYNPSNRRPYGRHAGNTVDYKIVIVDEVSMMPLSMMARVLDALKKDALLILVGDQDQLASVESGSVLADICEASSKGPQFVEMMTGKFRFGEGSPVAAISAAVNAGNADELKKSIRVAYPQGVDEKGKPYPTFRWVDPETDTQGLKDVARMVLAHASELCTMATCVESDTAISELLAFRESLQVVCAHKKGKLGVSGWNSSIDRKLGNRARGQWYVGRPVMVLINDYVNDLSNGDIGVICSDTHKNIFAAFQGNDGIRRIAVSKLPPVETVHALTIHKSQGSEYGHTVVVLPTTASRIVTRELVYTGITRAKPDLTIVATEEVLQEAACTPIRRATGLANGLFKALREHEDRWPFSQHTP
jgi:exodeoxyribonuclease V alpha subunit